MSGKEMYERNPFSSSSFCSFPGTKKNAKEATIRGTPFHTVLDLSSNCEVACSLLQKRVCVVNPPPAHPQKTKKKRKCVCVCVGPQQTLISTACLRPFQKATCFNAHPKGFLCRWLFRTWWWKEQKKERNKKYYFLFSSFFGHGKKNGQKRTSTKKRKCYFKTVCAAPSGPPLVSSTGDAGWTESTFFGSRCWLMSDPKKDVAC